MLEIRSTGRIERSSAGLGKETEELGQLSVVNMWVTGWILDLDGEVRLGRITAPPCVIRPRGVGLGFLIPGPG